MYLTPERIAICVATYRRNDDLDRLLGSIEESLHAASTRTRVLVVDNNPDGDAAQVVVRHPSVSYVHEPQPGIVAARNRALREVVDRVDGLIFLDDDEWVSRQWFEAIVETSNRYRADVTWGPVVSVMPPGIEGDGWLKEVIQRPLHSEGAELRWAATNNVLIRRSALDRLENPWFAQEFSTTGGSDAELFWRIRRAGGAIVWASRALVYEEVPPERATKSWVWRRTVRYGNVSGRLLMRDRSRPVVLLIGLARAAVGAALLIADLVLKRRVARRGFEHAAKGWGMASSALDRNVQEYARA